jgi:hypothetical protein
MTEDMKETLESAAFPFTHNSSSDSLTATGMTLRDYFAAKAMQAVIMSGAVPTGIMIDTAKEAYQMADAMLTARAEQWDN